VVCQQQQQQQCRQQGQYQQQQQQQQQQPPPDARAVFGSSVFQKLVTAAGSINVRDSEGHTALLLAVGPARARVKALGTLRVLLTHGADPNAAEHDGTTPLFAAIRAAQFEWSHDWEDHGGEVVCCEIVSALLRAGANLRVEPPAPAHSTRNFLVSAVDSGCEALVRLLLAAGARSSTSPDDAHHALNAACTRTLASCGCCLQVSMTGPLRS
jgi:ankyrin repeat protein